MKKTCIRIFGKERETPRSEWKDVVCHVTYDDPKSHRQIVEDSFQYDLGLDLQDIKRDNLGHFSAPHNVGCAILRYHHFRKRFLFFEYSRCQYISIEDAPTRPADSQGDTYSLWVDLAPPSD